MSGKVGLDRRTGEEDEGGRSLSLIRGMCGSWGGKRNCPPILAAARSREIEARRENKGIWTCTYIVGKHSPTKEAVPPTLLRPTSSSSLFLMPTYIALWRKRRRTWGAGCGKWNMRGGSERSR